MRTAQKASGVSALYLFLPAILVAACAPMQAPLAATPRESPTTALAPTLTVMPTLVSTAASSAAETRTPERGATVPLLTRPASPALVQIEPTAAMTTTFPELTFEQDLSIHPPPPSDLRAVVLAGVIQLSWKAPPPVSIPHYYDDHVLYYKIYRRTQEAKFAFLARTAEMTYADTNAAAGIKYYYTVTDVRENENESTYAPEVEATRPP